MEEEILSVKGDGRVIHVGNYQNEEAQQYHDFYCIIDKKLYASPHPVTCV